MGVVDAGLTYPAALSASVELTTALHLGLSGGVALGLLGAGTVGGLYTPCLYLDGGPGDTPRPPDGVVGRSCCIEALRLAEVGGGGREVGRGLEYPFRPYLYVGLE